MYESYFAAAQHLGLAMNPPVVVGLAPYLTISGERDGHVVCFTRDVYARRATVDVYFSPPFDLGLNIAPAGQLPFIAPPIPLRAIGRLFAGGDIEIGAKAFDNHFSLHGDEPARVVPLVKAVQDDLAKWFDSDVAFEINDARVHFRRPVYAWFFDSPQEIINDVEAALSLAKRIEAARSAVPIAAALAPHVPGFRGLAEANRMAMTSTPLALWGAVGGFGVWAHAVRHEAGAFEIEMTIRFGEGDATLHGSLKSTGKTGSFDNAFVTSNADWVLTDAVKAELLAFANTGHALLLGDGGLQLRAPLGKDPYPIAANVDRVIAILRSLEAARRPRAPYRH